MIFRPFEPVLQLHGKCHGEVLALDKISNGRSHRLCGAKVPRNAKVSHTCETRQHVVSLVFYLSHKLTHGEDK